MRAYPRNFTRTFGSKIRLRKHDPPKKNFPGVNVYLWKKPTSGKKKN